METVLSNKGIVYPHHLIDPALPFSLNNLSEGVSELMVHPACAGNAWRVRDFEMLVDPVFLQTLRAEDISLISFAQLHDSLSSLTGRGTCDDQNKVFL